MYDLIVVGGGPAGLTATMYAIRKRLDVLMVSKDLGGKTNYRLALPWIEEYQVIRGLEIVDKFRRELEYLDFSRLMDGVDKVEKQNEHFVVLTRGGKELETKAVIIATGARQKLMDVPGEKEFMMRGLCYSALSYAPLFIDRTTAVIGDGELALRSTAEMATIADMVYLVRSKEEDPKSPLGKKVQAAGNVKILNGHKVLEVLGDEFAYGLKLMDLDGETRQIKTDGIFVEMALRPSSGMVADLVKMDKHERIIVDCATCTDVPGVFAAGDVTNSYAEQVLVAVGEGAKAALSAYDYVLPTL
jgi:alkyl hydroperoxide reductase subunit F